jgi:signal transduction histidine kinase
MFQIEREDFFLQILADYILLNEISAGTLNEHCLDKVGLKFGLRVEDQYRLIYGLKEPLTLLEFVDLAVCFITGLGGRFTLIASEQRTLVFECDKCVFDFMPLKTWGLCRMMTAIVGGIAARNFLYCKVCHKKIRPQGAKPCRVVFYLSETVQSQAAEGIVFTADPASYLLTPEELNALDSKQYKENFKTLQLTHRELEARYNQLRDEIFSDLGLGILTVNEQVQVNYINRAARDLLNTTNSREILIPAEFRQLLEETLTAEKRFNQYEVAMPFIQGTRHYSFNTAPFFYDNNKISGAVSVFQDISEKKLLEKEMQQMEKFSMVAELAAGTAHEIRNPMTTLRGFLQILLKEFEPASKGFEYCMLMIEEIDRANAIIKEFLLLTKPAAPDLQDTDLYLVLEDVFLLIESKSLLENVSLEKGFYGKLPPVRIDQAQIKQVFLNLSTNAIQAMPEGGKLTISASAGDGKAFIRFTDTGCGISEAVVNKIFDPFFTTKENGTGLGLAISYRIMEAHGGRLIVDSKPGQGSTFTVELPAL